MSEPRWIRQQDTFRCGPVAVANALKWAGIPCSWKRDKDYLSELCRVNRTWGTKPKDFENALREASGGTFAVRRRKRFKINEVVDWVEGRNLVIFDFTWPLQPIKGQRDGHYSACVDIMGPKGWEFFKFINLEGENTVTWVSREWYRKIFSRRCYGDHAYFVRRR